MIDITPQTLTSKKTATSAATLVQEMLEKILTNRAMDVREKTDQLHELGMEHTFFNSPEQAVQIISVLAGIIGSDPNPSVRAAALQVMEQMIALEERAEARSSKPPIDWSAVNILLHQAKEQVGLDARDAAISLGRANSIMPAEEAAVLVSKAQPSVGAKASGMNIQGAPINRALEANILLAQETIAERPQARAPQNLISPENAEPVIMKMLRSVAETDDQEHIRALADRIFTKIQNLSTPKPSSSFMPTLTEG